MASRNPQRPEPSVRAAVAGASLGYTPTVPRPAMPVRPTSATAALVRDALASRGVDSARVDVVAAVMPAGWIRIRAEGNAKLQGPKQAAADAADLCVAWGLETRRETDVSVLCRGTWTPTRADLRGEASRALAAWLQEQGCRPDAAVLRYEGGTTVEAFQERHACAAAEWLAGWLAGASIDATCGEPARVGSMWVVNVVARRRAA
jgi:hypothetical protein